MSGEPSAKRSRPSSYAPDTDLDPLGVVSALPEDAGNALEKAEEQQDRINDLLEQEEAAIRAVRREFDPRRKALADARDAILADVPNFWLGALKQHEVFGQLIDPQLDEPVLAFLRRIEASVGKYDAETNEALETVVRFVFGENPFFDVAQGQPTKTVGLDKNTGDDGLATASITSTTIHWNEGQSPAERRKTLKENHPSANSDDDSDDGEELSLLEWLEADDTEYSTAPLVALLQIELCQHPIPFFRGLGPVEEGDMDDDDDGSDVPDLVSESS